MIRALLVNIKYWLIGVIKLIKWRGETTHLINRSILLLNDVRYR